MDVSAMADRLSAAVSSASAGSNAGEATAVADPTPTPVVTTPDTSSSSAAAPEPVPVQSPADPNASPDPQFEDDPDELNFDEPATPPPVAAISPIESAPPVVPGTEFDNLLPKAVETAFLKTNRGRNLLATYKSERVLKEAPNFDPATGENLGGLGYMPTPEQIKDYHARASDLEAMQHEFINNPQSWAINHFGVGPDGNLREGAVQTLSTLPAVINDAYDRAVQSGNVQLQEQAVTAFKAVFQPMALEYLNGLYDRARQIADPVKREQYLNGARTIEFDLTGKFRGDDQLAPPKPEDALAQERRAIEQEKQQLLSWRQKNQSESVKAVHSAVYQDVDKTLDRYIEKAFATANLKTAMKPFAYQASFDKYKVQVQQAVRQDRIAFRDYNFALSRLNANSSADERQNVVKLYAQGAQRAINNSYRNVLKELVDGTVTQNNATRATAAAAATQTAPRVNGGQPPPQSLVAGERLQRQPGEDRADFIQRRLAQATGSVSAPQR